MSGFLCHPHLEEVVCTFFSGLWNWQFERLPECASGYSVDLDSTVFERYGHQQGALRGPNPRKHGRPSHHPLVAVLAEIAEAAKEESEKRTQ